MTGAIPPPKLRRGPRAVNVPVAREHAEHKEQVAFIAWFRLQHRGVLIYAIPNGSHLAGTAKQRAAQMTRLKDEGFVPGMPDLHIPEWSVWIEMKNPNGGKVRPSQGRVIEHLRAVGQIVIVAFGWEDARIKLRAVLAASEAQS